MFRTRIFLLNLDFYLVFLLLKTTLVYL